MNTGASTLIGIDLDGVIIDHTENKIRLARRYGVHLLPEQTHAEHMGRFFSKEIYAEIKAELYEPTDTAFDAPLAEGAFDGLSRLRESSVPYALVSLQRNPMHALHLLEIHGLWGTCFTPANTFFARDADEKAHIAHRLGVTHFVDDEPNILLKMFVIPKRIIYDPRRLFLGLPYATHASSWEDVMRLIGVRS